MTRRLMDFRATNRALKRRSALSDRNRAILLISCLDQRGLLATLTGFIYRHGGNIRLAEHHTNFEEGIYFLRLEWDLEGFQLDQSQITDAFEPLARKFNMDWEIRFSSQLARIAIFVSKYDHCLVDLLYRSQIREIPGEVVLVVSNHPDLETVTLPLGIPFYLFPITSENKLEQEEKEIELLRSHRVDLVILARYMQVLTPWFLGAFPNRIINIHHSFLPAFVGEKPYHQAYRRGVKLIGATSHYVTEDLDEGPIIEQDVCRVSHKDSLADLIRKGRDLERQVLARAVRLHLLNKVLPYGNRTVVFD
jgi:formyltetrahydrofolate deformylase